MPGYTTTNNWRSVHVSSAVAGAGGGWFVNSANGDIPADVVCVRCRLATYYQNMQIHESVRSGARDSAFAYSRSYGIVIGPEAIDPVNVSDRVFRY